MQLSMPCSMGVLAPTSSVSIVYHLTCMKMHMQQRNTVSMYVTHVGKSESIMVRRFKAICLHHSSCSWLAVTCCLVSNSLLCCRLSDHHSMLAASKQQSIIGCYPSVIRRKSAVFGVTNIIFSTYLSYECHH